MKHLKEKLIATIAMLLVATVMLTSASFAWFTISTAPEISDVKASVTANGNLEIALDAGSLSEPADSDVGDAGHNEKWGNLIDLKGAFDNTSAGQGIVLKPVLVDENSLLTTPTIKYPHFGLDGRIDNTTALTRKSVEEGNADNFKDLHGVQMFTDNDQTHGPGVWAFEIDYWLRSNLDGNVTLADEVYRDGGTDHEMGKGSYIRDNRTTIKIVDVTGSTIHSVNRASDGKLSLDSAIPLTANSPKLIKMFVYLDGADLTNADFTNVETPFEMNVQFKHSVELNDLNAHQSGYGRETAGVAGF